MSLLPPLKKMYIEQKIKKTLKSILVDLPKYELLVGIPGGTINEKAEQKYKIKQQADIAFYAAANEFGTFTKQINDYEEYTDKGIEISQIPARPFLRTTFEGERLKKIQKRSQIELTKCAKENRRIESFLETMGLYAAGQVRDNINKGNWEENSEITKKRKKSSKPLIDTGTMKRSITAWVKKK